MLVILLIGRGGLFLLELLLEFVQALKFSMGPTLDSVLAALLLEGCDANAELACGGVNWEVETAREVLIAEVAAAGRFLLLL